MKSRLTSFYGKERVTNKYYNEYLQIIFDPKVHRIIEECIEKYQWNWAWGFTDEFVSAFPAIDIEKLGYNDRGYPLNINDLRKQALWYAKESNLDQRIRKAEKKICYHCKKKFLESSLPFIFIHPFTASNINFCYYCLSDASVGKKNHTKKSISKFANDLASFIGRPPSQTKYVSLQALLIDYDYYSYSHGDRLVLLNILCERPDKDTRFQVQSATPSTWMLASSQKAS